MVIDGRVAIANIQGLQLVPGAELDPQLLPPAPVSEPAQHDGPAAFIERSNLSGWEKRFPETLLVLGLASEAVAFDVLVSAATKSPKPLVPWIIGGVLASIGGVFLGEAATNVAFKAYDWLEGDANSHDSPLVDVSLLSKPPTQNSPNTGTGNDSGTIESPRRAEDDDAEWLQPGVAGEPKPNEQEHLTDEDEVQADSLEVVAAQHDDGASPANDNGIAPEDLTDTELDAESVEKADGERTSDEWAEWSPERFDRSDYGDPFSWRSDNPNLVTLMESRSAQQAQRALPEPYALELAVEGPPWRMPDDLNMSPVEQVFLQPPSNGGGPNPPVLAATASPDDRMKPSFIPLLMWMAVVADDERRAREKSTRP